MTLIALVTLVGSASGLAWMATECLRDIVCGTAPINWRSIWIDLGVTAICACALVTALHDLGRIWL